MGYLKAYLKKELVKGENGTENVSYRLLCEDSKFVEYLNVGVLCGCAIIDVGNLIQGMNLLGCISFYTFEHTSKTLKEHESVSICSDRSKLIPRKELELPVLHWSMYDLFTINECSLGDIYYRPRYIKYLDSSIWNYFFPIFVLKKQWNGQEQWAYNNNVERVKYVLESIWRNSKHNLYCFANTHEYYELNDRLIADAFLDDKAHGQAVSPFIFHSEYEMREDLTKRLFKKERDGNKKDITKYDEAKSYSYGVKWRILLLDDYANRPLKERKKVMGTFMNEQETMDQMDIGNHRKNEKVTGKLKVIVDDLRTKGIVDVVYCCPTKEQIEIRYTNRHGERCELNSWDWKDINGYQVSKYTDPDIAIVCAVNVKQALQLLALQRYDIVLLDYLLDNRADKKGREYSYSLLKLIYGKCNGIIDKSLNKSLGIGSEVEDISTKDLIGPNGRLYFMHISAFVNAIQERLQEQHLLRSEPFWHIARGACPTNTPELFLYYLYRAMEKRYESVMMQGDECVGSLIDFLNEIFSDNPRMQCVNKFNTLLNLRAQYNRIKNDVYKEERELLKMKADNELINGCSPLDCRSSRLICSIFKDILYYGNSFWEHLQHLIYLTAYGTIRQWTEMWEEYSFIKPRLMLNEEKGKKVCKAIEDYIIALKSNS